MTAVIKRIFWVLVKHKHETTLYHICKKCGRYVEDK